MGFNSAFKGLNEDSTLCNVTDRGTPLCSKKNLLQSHSVHYKWTGRSEIKSRPPAYEAFD